MNSFVNAIVNAPARTENGMKARASSASSVVNLFYAIGASRGKNIIPAFVAAFVENPELALRVVLWARDIRGGAGERSVFRDIFKHLEVHEPDIALAILDKIPELGRWDDVLVATLPLTQAKAFRMIGDAIRNGQKARTALVSIDTMDDTCVTILLNSIKDGSFTNTL